MTIHVDGLRYQPTAVERAEAIERSRVAGRRRSRVESAVNQAAAAGATASEETQAQMTTRATR